MTAAVLMFAAALNVGNAEFDRTATEGAARITVDRFAAEFAEKGPERGTLTRAMMGDPKVHRTRADSEKACRELWKETSEQAFRDEAEAVRKRLGLDKSFELKMDGKARAAIDAKFSAVFDAERREAVAQQAKTLVTALRPSESEFEKKSEDVLRREMTERIVAEQKTAVFEENRATVTTAIVEPMLASGRAERQRQIEYIKHVRSDVAVPSKLAKDISAKLAANVNERSKTAKTSEAWGVFPSVTEREMPQVVEKRIVERFVGEIESIRLSVKPEDVEKIVAADPAAHAKARASEKIFAERYAARTLADALAESLGEVDEADRKELREYLTQRMASDPPRKAVERIVRRDIMPKWKAARAAVAKKSAEKLWPTLMDGTWYPSAEIADEVVARSDYDRAVRQWRKIKGLEKLAGANGGKPVLEETEKKVDAQVSAAFARARSAIAAQSAIVDAVHPIILADARERKASFFRRTPNLASLTESLTDATFAKWSEVRMKTLWPDGNEPSNASKQHTELFPSVRRKIELVARQILEEMNVPEQMKKPDEPQPQEKPEEPPEDTPDENPSQETEDLNLLSLSVERIGSEVEIKLLNGKKVISRDRVPSNAAAFRGAMERLTRKLSSDVLQLK